MGNACKDARLLQRYRHMRLFVIILVLFLSGCMTAAVPPVMHAGTTTPQESSWVALHQRPLHLPMLSPNALCPTTHGHRVMPALGPLLGQGPVYAAFFGSGPDGNEQGVLKYADASSFGDGTSHWGGQKATFFINPVYRGPVLIRGRQVDGSGLLRFNDTNAPPDVPDQGLLSELRFTADVGGAPWPSAGSYTRVQMPGCYAYQVDGTTFSYLIIFKAVAMHFKR